MFEKWQNAQAADLFPPLCVHFSCHTQSMAASNRLDWRLDSRWRLCRLTDITCPLGKKSLALVHFVIYQTRPKIELKELSREFSTLEKYARVMLAAVKAIEELEEKIESHHRSERRSENC